MPKPRVDAFKTANASRLARTAPAVGAALVLAATALDGAELELRSECRCPAAVVTLGDVAYVLSNDPAESEALKAVELFPAPPPGQRRLVRMRQIQDLLLLRGVDLVAHSLTLRTLNTRGFNGDSNYRLNQLIDGMDNTPPGLGFAAGNIFGVSPLDIHAVELLVGASSALYGPGGVNGTLLMTSKDPFDYPGLSFSNQTGVMNVNSKARKSPSIMEDVNFRYAKSFRDKFAFKINASYLRATDWYAADYRDRTNLDDRGFTRDSNPGYDGVNVYGDDIIVPVNLKDVAPTVAEGVAEQQGYIPGTPEYDDFIDYVVSFFPDQVITRTGYHEDDIVDYDSRNLRLNTALHYRINEKLEAIGQVAYAEGTAVYTAINRFSLRDFSIVSGKLEFRGPRFYIKAYGMSENSGKTFDAGTAMLRFNELWKPSEEWYEDYIGGFTQTALLGGSEEAAHDFGRLLADNRDKFGNVFTDGEPARPLPGTPEFKDYFNHIVTVPANEGGALVVDHSKVYHVEGLYDFREQIELVEILLGVSHRIYSISSDGTIFWMNREIPFLSINSELSHNLQENW